MWSFGLDPDKDRRWERWALWLPPVLVLLVHWPHLLGFFYMDDYAHLSFIQDPANLLKRWVITRADFDKLWFTRPEVDFDVQGISGLAYYFRPYYFVSLWLDQALFGFSAFGYHLHSLLLHALNAFLLGLLARRLGLGSLVALFGATLFAVHPLAFEPLGWVCARADLQSVAFGLLGSLCFLRSREHGLKRDYLLALLCGVLSFLAKENGLVWPFIWLAYELWRRFDAKSEDRAPRPALWPLALLALLDGAVMLHALLVPPPPDTWFAVAANKALLRGAGYWPLISNTLMVSLGALLSGQLSQTAFPSPALVVYVPLSLLILSAALYGLLKLRHSRLLWPALWAAAFLASVLWLTPSFRYLYGAWPGLALLLGAGLAKLWQARRAATRYAGRAVFALAALYWAETAFVYASDAALVGGCERRAVDSLVAQVKEKPQLTDVYLLNVSPLLFGIHQILGPLFDRPATSIHLLTYSPLPDPTELELPLRATAFWDLLRAPQNSQPPEKTFSSVNVLAPDVLEVQSSPAGYIIGQSTPANPFAHYPLHPLSDLFVDNMWVHLGPLAPNNGFSELRFTFPHSVLRPDALCLLWRDGRPVPWRPEQ